MERPTQLCNRNRSRVYRVMLLLTSLCLIMRCVSAEGGLITDDKVYSVSGSPYTITEDIVVEKGATLNIEPGVTMRFDSGVGVTVRGVIKVKGTPDMGILLTSAVPPSVPLTMPKLRLVDGARPTQGRLQMFYNDKWRSICTNSRNWTQADMAVACGQMGFTGGHYFEWQDRVNNDTATVLYEAPSCTGQEETITSCAWHTHVMGGGACDLHPDLGLECDEYHANWRGTDYWRGLFFDDAEATYKLIQQSTLYQKVSKSELSYVTIENAGMGPKRDLTSAIMSQQVPPSLSFVSVSANIYNGINFTLPATFVHIVGSNFIGNRGYGIYVNTSVGSVLLDEKSLVKDNMADGIKYNLHNKEPDITAADTFQDFCIGASNPNQAYPLITVARQNRNSYSQLNCERSYISRPGFVFTVQFIYGHSDELDAASIEIRDRDKGGQLLATYNIQNDTFLPSIVSISSSVWIKFTAKEKRLSIVYLEIVASKAKAYDLSLYDTIVDNNNGHGVSVDNMRSLVHIHHSNLTSSIFGSGLSVRRGAGDVNVTYSTISHNLGDGVNITYEGGLQNISWSHVEDNKGRGVAIWFNESGNDIKMKQETDVGWSVISNNFEQGILIGNFCREAFVDIHDNTFRLGQRAALDIESCWRSDGGKRRVFVGHNTFKENRRLALEITPAVNMDLRIEFNSFLLNSIGTVLIKNEDKLELQHLPFTGRIFFNDFIGNSGYFVMCLTLSVLGIDQHIDVQRNTIKKNMIVEPYENIKARNKAAGVITIGSANIHLYRNLIDNPQSVYELSSQLQDQSKPINGSYNWLGSKEEIDIFERVFDRRDRYNLALINFHPFLLNYNNVNTTLLSPEQLSEPDFRPDNGFIIGGEINGHVYLPEGVFTVTRDIYVHEKGIFTIPYGVTLEFEKSIGMMVAGQLLTEGSGDENVLFTLKGTTEARQLEEARLAESLGELVVESGANITVDEYSSAMEMNETTPSNDTEPVVSVPVKLVGGTEEKEGRLMVYVDGKWGSVCNHGWTEFAAAIACQQMGLVLNPDDWSLEQAEIPADPSHSGVLLSNVQCDEFDTDLTQCKSDGASELENSCDETEVVGLRCYAHSWGGIRLGMTADECTISGVVVEKAGLLDYSTRTFKPALQIDFHHHVIKDLVVRDNLQDGMGILYNDLYAIQSPEARIFRNSKFINNHRHGVSLAQLGVNISDSELSGNKRSGLHFNPWVGRAEQRELSSWLKIRSEEMTPIPTDSDVSSVFLNNKESIYYITKTIRNSAVNQTIKISTIHENVIGIQVLNPVMLESTEHLYVFDYQEAIVSEQIKVWDMCVDMAAFPTTSSSYAITIKYASGPYALGDVIFILTSINRRAIAQAEDLGNFLSKWPSLYISNSRIKENDIGISTLHYNRYFTDDADTLLRCTNETIQVVSSSVANNRKQAVYVLSPFRVHLQNHDISEITFMFNDTLIEGNGKGIEQYGWDIRESNNLFHWVLDGVEMQNNRDGGMMVMLPYVWQYTENYTHSVFINASTFLRNDKFEFSVSGHFAKLNITHTRFEENTCKTGLFSVRGMEKKMFIHDNFITSNRGSYMVEFNTNSQSEILGSVLAYFEYNTVQKNQHLTQRSYNQRTYQPASYTIAVKGIQKVNITHNILGSNEMDYELIAGVYTSRLDNYLNVEANWWGTQEANVIEEMIFDFDDWNNFAIADYKPFLIEGRLEAILSSGSSSKGTIGIDNLGGRLLEDLRLPPRTEPYIIRSDLTVMPGVTLVIEPGANLQFYPSVGILVLGRLEANGQKHDRIKMSPINKDNVKDYRVGREVERSFEIRLCLESNCSIGQREGFLDIYNKTTQQWVPICDSRFTERNAQVVCHQLGFNRLNVFYGRDIRTEMYPTALIRIRSWPEPIQCDGSEAKLDECPVRMNGQIYDNDYSCDWDGDFVFISCDDTNLPEPNMEYWGGIRFSISHWEHNDVYSRIHDTHTHNQNEGSQASVLEWVEIIGAGVLHGERAPAILSLYETPKIRGITVKNSAYDGLSLVSAREKFDMLYNWFENNLGVGVSMLGLFGETREADQSSFTPVTHLRLPYHMFGIIDICDSTKEIRIEERVLLYYKYDNQPVDCVKIFSSVFNVKNFGFRLLQFNLHNSTSDPSVPDRIVLYDGDIYNTTTQVLSEIHMNSSNSQEFFKTIGTSLSVQLHATGSSGDLGFVAEVVTLPAAAMGINRNELHNLTYNEYHGNREGALFAATAGEVNPWLTLSWSRFESNGHQFYGNFSSSRAAITLDLQNMQDVYIKNNLICNNTGGVLIWAGSMGAATKLQANVTNNLFLGNTFWPSLYIESRPNSAYQHALIAYNDFSWAESTYHDVITLAQVVSDFSYNYVHSNLGRHILDIYGFEKVRLPVYQTTTHNSFSKNRAVDPTYQGTIVVGSAGQQYVDNVFYNLDNAYEMVAVNESVRCNVSSECTDEGSLDVLGKADPRSDVWKTPVDARNNWWGFNTSVAVSGRIHEKADDETLLSVDFTEWKLNNFTLLKGCEPGYNLVGDACYLYIGAPVTYEEAKVFCRKDNASLPFLQKWYWEVQFWIKEQQPEYIWEYDMVWVQHYDIVSGCAAFVYRQVQSVNCSLKLPFICESDPDNTIDPYAWTFDTLVLAAIASTAGALLLVAGCLACWVCKSRHRRKERIIRRNSIRASIRSNRSAISTTSGEFSDMGHRRRIIQTSQHAIPMTSKKKVGGAQGHLNGVNGFHGSFDSISKSHLNSSMDEDPSYEVYEENINSPGTYNFDNRFSHDPVLENENVNAVVHPSFDLTFQNQGFRDNSNAASREISAWQGSDSNLEANRSPKSFYPPPYSPCDPYNHQRGIVTIQNPNGPPPPLPPPLKGPVNILRQFPKSTTSSLRNDSLQGSNPQLATCSIATDSTLEMKKEMDLAKDNLDDASAIDVHLAPTLPRDAAPSHHQSADLFPPRTTSSNNTPLPTSGDYFSQGRSLSQPLETAM